jgi:hypothetical protein
VPLQPVIASAAKQPRGHITRPLGALKRRLMHALSPNNYRSDRVRGDPSVIARSPCDEAIQGPQHAGRQQPRRSYCGPWIASLR